MLKVGLPLGILLLIISPIETSSWLQSLVRTLLLAPICAFFASLAIMRVHSGVLEYCRFLSWKPINAADVVSAGSVWPNFIGQLKLRHFVNPWGRIYWVMDTDVVATRALLRYLQALAEGRVPDT